MPHPPKSNVEDIVAKLRRVSAFMVECNFGYFAAIFGEAGDEIERLRLQIPVPGPAVPSGDAARPVNASVGSTNKPQNIGLEGRDLDSSCGD